jgi:hypothetical protein
MDKPWRFGEYTDNPRAASIVQNRTSLASLKPSRVNPCKTTSGKGVLPDE